jgi:hypothetical protein
MTVGGMVDRRREKRHGMNSASVAPLQGSPCHGSTNMYGRRSSLQALHASSLMSSF